MNFNKLTTNFQQAINEAQSIAVGKDHNMIESAHVLAALLDQEHSSIKHVLMKSGVNVNQLRQSVHETIEMMPVIANNTGQVNLSNNLIKVLNLADKLAQQRNDQYIASELFALALLDSSVTTAQLLKHAGAQRAVLAPTLDGDRGYGHVNGHRAEVQRQARQ